MNDPRLGRVPKATVCKTCDRYLRKVPADGQLVVPPLSIAGGWDFGRPFALGLEPLRFSERRLISLTTAAVNVVYLKRTYGHVQPALKGHAVTFANHGPAQMAALASGRYLRMRLAALNKEIHVTFEQAPDHWGQQERERAIRSFSIRPNVVFDWLKALKHLNPLYADLDLDKERSQSSGERPLEDALLDFGPELLSQAVSAGSAAVFARAPPEGEVFDLDHFTGSGGQEDVLEVAALMSQMHLASGEPRTGGPCRHPTTTHRPLLPTQAPAAPATARPPGTPSLPRTRCLSPFRRTRSSRSASSPTRSASSRRTTGSSWASTPRSSSSGRGSRPIGR